MVELVSISIPEIVVILAIFFVDFCIDFDFDFDFFFGVVFKLAIWVGVDIDIVVKLEFEVMFVDFKLIYNKYNILLSVLLILL